MLHSRYVITVIFYWNLLTNGAVVRNEDICGFQNGRRLYLELGEQGVLHARNVSLIKNAPRLQDSRIYTSNSSHDQCSLELVTCPSCVITLTFKSISLPQNCGDGGFMLDSPCRCDYVWISEPPYDDVSGIPFCGLYSPISYRSNTRTLSITLLYSQSHHHAFTLEYTSERNRIHLKGTDMPSGIGNSVNNSIGGILTSPFFPARYPRDLGMEYIITCPSEAPSCRVRVLFSDFQLAAVSIIEFYDWNGQRLDVSSGVRFRPPVIVSSGSSLLIRFYANGGTGLGYKAFYSFVLGHLYDKSIQPITDCGGYVENLGGAITMMDMVDQGHKIYDCVWLIRPPKTFLHMKTEIYLKIITFEDMAGSTELIVKQGPTSALLPLEILRHPASKLLPRRLKEHVAPISSGFHVSLRGTFGPTSHLAMAYAAFGYTDCFTGSDFLCQNHRCIPSQLNCDGFDHCGDNSDEPATCTRDWDLEPHDRKWHTNKANYYFPKIDRYPDLRTATLVFVASSLGLITLISALIVLLYRMGARARQQRELQSRLRTISELLDFDLPDGARLEEVNGPDDPPVYESPPGYDEVVKLGLESERGKRKKRKSHSSFRRSRSCNSQSVDYGEQTSVGILADGGAGTSHSYHNMPVTDTNQQRPIPESPPPPYDTPPGTVANNLHLLGHANSPECAADNVSDHDETTRQYWSRNSGEFSRSLPVSEAVTPECATSSIDAESLGAYLLNYAANSTECSAPQLSSWRDASMDINPESGKRSKDVEAVEGVEGVKDPPGVSTDEICSCQEACASSTDYLPEISSTAQEMATHGNVKPRSKRKGKNKVMPSSSSAIATLSSVPFTSPKTVSLTSSVTDPTTSAGTSSPIPPLTALVSESTASSASSATTKNVIVKLFGNSKFGNRSPRSMSLNSTNFSTASSSPCSTIGKSFKRNGVSRKFSISSHDSYISKLSALSASSSYEKLQDNFEIVSEPTSLLSSNTQTDPPVATLDINNEKTVLLPRPCPSRYTNCDLDSLSEGIKILDSFLARQGVSVNYPQNSSVAVMLFGTPKHTRKRVREDRDEIEWKRFWRSTEDTSFFEVFRSKE